MIGMRTILEVADNSGARRLACILPRGGGLGLRAGLGDIVTASVKEAAPDSAIKKGKVVRCVIVRMRKETRRKDGTYIRFDSNAAVPVKIRLKKNDVVKVITGRDKGKQGRVIEIDRRTGKIVVEHVMMMKRHTKPNPAKQIKGGIAERESPIHVSNVKKLDKE